MEPPQPQPPPPATSSAAAVRVLARPPPSPSPAPTTTTTPTSFYHPPNPNPSPNPTSPSPPHDGVVVVGFVGSGSHLINRILDADVFGSGGATRCLAGEGRIRFHHEVEKKMVFLHFASSPAAPEAALEDLDGGGELRGLLFMFSVCHVIIFLHEGLRFDTQILKEFRLLQASKHALAPFVRSLVAPTMSSKVAPSHTPTQITPRASSISPPARRGGPTGRQPSAISLMSGTGSHPSVLPGQCTPVALFVFEDLFDGPSPAPSAEDTGDASSLNPASSTDGLPKPNLALKGSGSVVMLARSAIRSEGSFRKKLHSSLEGQIRFLLKKCRTLAGAESGHLGPRGVTNVNHLPLFSLDTSRAVALLDHSVNQKGEPLDIITGLIEDSLSSKSALDILSLENDCQPMNNEDVQLIKDFIFRQSDTLRGRGGHSSNATAGSVAGVGMVAAAAAAAAASAAAGKPLSAPDLPSFDKWLSVSTSILSALLTAGNGLHGNAEIKKGSTQTSGNEKTEQVPSAGSNAVETALSFLEASKGLNMKFSLSWCQRSLPAAKEVYLKDLPAFYPTSMHEVQLQKAVQSFHSMVKGPAVQVFLKKLEEECRSIWESGRQQCDAVSLTGKPCMHQRHDKSPLSDAIEKHSSGYIFLHACACGRSRRLRDDPFDFETANISFNCFPNCEDLLPTLVLPRGNNSGSFPVSSWRLMRLGGARYYKPTKGLLQTGFCSKEKHLLRWTISLGKGKGKNCIHNGATTKPSSMRANTDPQAPPVVNGEVKSATTQVTPEIKPGKSENPRKQSEAESTKNSGISFGKGLPNFTMKKPFAEVVAGTVAKDSEFPALQQKRPPKPGSRKDERQASVADQTNGRGHAALNQCPQTENNSEKESINKTNSDTDGKPFLQIGSNIVPVIIANESKEPSTSLQQFIVYVGFEHECSYGHRFLLSDKHLKEFDSSYLQYGRSYPLIHDTESKDGSQKLLESASGLTTTMAVNNVKKSNRPMESLGRNSQQRDRLSLQPRVDSDKFQTDHRLSAPVNEKKGEDTLQCITVDDGGEAFSLLNRNLPIYMHCPHCKSSQMNGHQNTKFASAISQLQRIFIVTPDFPVLLATCPVVQFEDSCLPSNVANREQQSLFNLGCRVVLPPESFLTMRLPFVYGVETNDGSTHPLNHFEHQPELTAWLVGGTALQVVSIGHVTDEEPSAK